MDSAGSAAMLLAGESLFSAPVADYYIERLHLSFSSMKLNS